MEITQVLNDWAQAHMRVYKVKDESENIFALKAIKNKLAIEPEKALGISSGVSCSFLVKYYSIFEEGSITCIVMEYCPNGTLEDLIQQHIKNKTHFAEIEVLEILFQLTSAVFQLHAHSILHRDIKPANVFINVDNNYLLGDYGTGKVLETEFSLTSTMVGTDIYMAPELFGEGHNHSTPVDIWSLGVLMYYVMTLSYPFFAVDSFTLSRLLLTTDYKPIPSIEEGGYYTSQLIDIVNNMLIKDPQKRILADDILSKPIFSVYLKHIISKDILDVLKNKKILLRHVARDPELVAYLKHYCAYKNGEQPSEEEVAICISLIDKMDMSVTFCNERQAKRKKMN